MKFEGRPLIDVKHLERICVYPRTPQGGIKKNLSAAPNCF